MKTKQKLIAHTMLITLIFTMNAVPPRPIYFVTGNKGKLAEMQAAIPQVKQLLDGGKPIDLDEIQEIDAKKVIEAKIKQAFVQGKVPAGAGIIVEDTSLYMDALKINTQPELGLPGPLIKWFEKVRDGNKNEGFKCLYEIADAFKDYKASARAWIGYSKDGKTIEYFEGAIPGIIVAKRGEKGFGWDPYFQPSDPRAQGKTFAEMDTGLKNQFSMRGMAARAFLEKHPEYKAPLNPVGESALGKY